METLQVAWFFLIGVLLTGYAILDGFDLGVGFWHLFARKGERRVLLNAIGPVWDGNEVWLLTGGGAMFAAFPPVYATVFSGFYVALMLLLLALILRAVSIEYRGKVEDARWQTAWDVAFSLGSIVAGLLFSVALGNILRGVPLSADGEYAGTFLGLLNPYALLIGLVGLAMLATHGALFIVLKAEGELAEKAKGWARIAWATYLVLFLAASAATLLAMPHLLVNFRAAPTLWAMPVLALAVILLTGLLHRRGQAKRAFVASSLSIAAMWGLVGTSIFPALVPALGNPARSLTAFSASSSFLTLKAMLVIALIFMPLVVAYTIYVYRAFSGKVRLGPDSY